MLKRKTPLRANPEKIKAWQQRSREKNQLKRSGFKRQRSVQRQRQESTYSIRAKRFLEGHPICPVTGKRTSEIHHSAKRQGGWLLLERYWIAVSMEGHKWIEANKGKAKIVGLMVRIMETYKQHYDKLLEDGENPYEPIFYTNHPTPHDYPLCHSAH